MQDIQIQKLKGLIQSSPILSLPEKTEWTALLELMDDKQLNELQKILVEGSKKSYFAKAPENAKEVLDKPKDKPELLLKPGLQIQANTRKIEDVNLQNQKSISSLGALPVTKPAVTQIPKLSHILNMPRLGIDNKKPEVATPVKHFEPVKLEEKKPVLQAKPTVQNKPSGFMQRLKDILAEKELPAPKDNQPLEVTVPAPVKKPEPVSFVINQTPTAPLPVAPPIPVIQKNLTLENFSIKGISQVSQGKKIEGIATISGLQPRPIAANPGRQAVTTKPVVTNTQSGIYFGKTSEKEKEQILDEIKQDLEQKKWDEPVQVSINAQNVNVISGDLNIDKIEDLNTLSTKVLGFAEFGILIKTIKNLILKNGYHPVIFNIEKSPLYKAYIKTGVAILNNQITFALLEEKKSEGYLIKKNFEECADLLRQIQAG